MIFPKEIIEFTEPYLSFRHTVRSQLIYSSTLVFLISIFAALPFVETEVNVKSRGIIKASMERHEVTVPVSGRIDKVNMRENRQVETGEFLIAVESEELANKLRFIQQRRRLLKSYIADLNLLIRAITENKDFVYQNPVYQSERLTLEQELSDSDLKIQNLKKIHERNRQLYDREVISKSEFEQSEFQLQSEKKKRELLIKSGKNKWHQQKVSYQHELDRLQSDEAQLKEEKEKYRVHASVKGVLLNVKGLSEGSTVHPNQKIAEISPVGSKVAEMYVSTRDIGLLKKDMKVRLKIDAFDHNQWGYLTGNISEISNDVIMIEGKPVFRVRCSLDGDYLALANGYRGYLKKGMTLEGRFVVTRRSLFHLLYDNVDDWLNPA